MAWNPSPKVCAAREFGQRFGKDQVIILSLDLRKGTLEMTSYGRTKELCDQAKGLGDAAYEALMRELEKGTQP